MISSERIRNTILIIALVSNLLASVLTIAIQMQANAERKAITIQRNREQSLIICILQVAPADRDKASIDSCKAQTGVK